MAIKHAFVSGKADGADATQVQPSNWNAGLVVDSTGIDIPHRADAPATPASTDVRLFGKMIAGGALPAFVGPSGLDSALQPFFGRNRIGMWVVTGAFTTAPLAFGMAGPSTQGTVAARTTATTNLLTSTRRLGQLSASAAGNFTGFRASAFQFFRGNVAGMGGFRFVARWGCSDAATVAGARTFVGMAAASTTAVDPSTQTNIIGVGTDATDGNLVVMHNDGAGTATRIPLGANFPDHTLSADAYELALFCAPNDTTIGYQVTRLNTGDVASGTISTDIPASTVLLGPQVMRNNGATALSVGIDLISMYVETDN